MKDLLKVEQVGSLSEAELDRYILMYQKELDKRLEDLIKEAYSGVDTNVGISYIRGINAKLESIESPAIQAKRLQLTTLIQALANTRTTSTGLAKMRTTKIANIKDVIKTYFNADISDEISYKLSKVLDRTNPEGIPSEEVIDLFYANDGFPQLTADEIADWIIENYDSSSILMEVFNNGQ